MPELRAHTLLRERLVLQGIAFASRLDGHLLHLETLADSIGAAPEDVAAVFASDAEFKALLFDRLSARFDYYVNNRLSVLAADASFEAKVDATMRGYHDFALEETANFGALCVITNTPELPRDFDANLEDFHLHPCFEQLLELTRDEIRRLDITHDAWTWIIASLQLYTTVHGVCCIATYGINRFMSTAGKNQLMNAAARHSLRGLDKFLLTGTAPRIEPKARYVEKLLEAVPAARDFPHNTKEEMLAALYRGAVEYVILHGWDELTIERAAAQAELKLGDASNFLDPDVSFELQFEDHLNHNTEEWVRFTTKDLGEDALPIQFGKAFGISYIGSAIVDPDSFNALNMIASRSIIPSSFEGTKEAAEVGGAFEYLLNLTRESIRLGGGPQEAWPLFETAMNHWVVAHGLANLFSTGCLRELDMDTKFALTEPILNATVFAMIDHLDLKFPDFNPPSEPLEPPKGWQQ